MGIGRRFWSLAEFLGAIITTGLALASYGLAFTSPVYTDEINWKLQQGHFFDDGYASRSTTLVPSCGPDTFATPALLVPIRYLDSFLLSLFATPGDIRIYGLFLFLAWFGVTWALLRRLFAQAASDEIVLAGVASVVTLGVMPLMMVISRPDQILLLGTTVFLIASVDERSRPAPSLTRDVVLAIAMGVGGAIVMCCHPRALLVLPIAILACLRVIQRRAAALTAAAAITVFAFTAFADFNTRLDCPGDPAVQHIFDFESIGRAASHGMLGPFFERLGQVFQAAPGLFFYLTQFGFRDYYISNIFPAYPFPGIGGLLTDLLAVFVGLLATIGMVSLALAAYRRLRARDGLVALAAVASSWALLWVSILARTTRNHYEAEFMEPLIVLTPVLSIWLARGELKALITTSRFVLIARAGFGLLMVLSIASQVAFLAGYLPFAAGTWRGPGYVLHQPFSVSTSGFPAMKDEILAAAARCGIEPDKKPERLVVDELTYFAFRHTKTPYLTSFLNPNGWGRGIWDLRGLLAGKGSDGAIVGCQWLLPGLERGAIQTGQFCCVPKF